MRKGFSLIEIIIIIAILPFILIVIDGLLTSILSDVPRSWKTIQSNSVMLHMLEQIQQDIDAAESLPESAGEYTAGDELLLIQQAGKVIHYRLKDDRVFRYGFAENRQIPEDTKSWSLPKTKITWQVHRRNGQSHALEIQHHIEYTLRGHLIKKMKNSNLFYVGILE